MKDAMIFLFPLPANRANSRGHWRRGIQRKKKFYAECDRRVLARLLTRPPAEPWDRSTITAELTMRNQMDDDNALAHCKDICDFLTTRAGYITDDSRTHLRWTAIPTQRITRKQEPCVTVTLTPA